MGDTYDIIRIKSDMCVSNIKNPEKIIMKHVATAPTKVPF